MSRPGPPNVAQSGPVRLRQIALVAKDLKKAEKLLTKVLGTEVIYVDPQVGKWGLENILVAIGGEVIEVVSPKQDGTTAGRLLEKRGDGEWKRHYSGPGKHVLIIDIGGYMIIMQHPDAQQRRELIESRGLAKVIYSNKYEDGVTVQYHPKGIKGLYRLHPKASMLLNRTRRRRNPRARLPHPNERKPNTADDSLLPLAPMWSRHEVVLSSNAKVQPPISARRSLPLSSRGRKRRRSFDAVGEHFRCPTE